MRKNKIKTLKQLKVIISRLKNKNKKIVFTNGCFDILHAGHVKYLRKAKEKGDVLIVAINSDASTRKLKGNDRPIIKLKDRAQILAALSCTDFITTFKEDTPIKLIKAIKPDILVKGSDWQKKDIIGADFVKSYGGKIITVAFIKGYSTTNIIKSIINATPYFKAD